MAGYNKCDKLELSKRIRAVQEYVLMDYSRSDIIAQAMTQWGISKSQAVRYYYLAYDSWQEITEKDTARRLNYHIHKRMKLLRQIDREYLKTPQGVKAQLDIVQDLAKLEGLYVRKLEVTGKEGEPIAIKVDPSPIDYSKLSDAALDEIIKARIDEEL